MATHSCILPWRLHGQRRLAGYSPWGDKESDTAEHLSAQACTHLSFKQESFFYGIVSRDD